MVDKNFETQVSYVIGVASVILAFVSPIHGIILGIVGLVMVKSQKDEFSKKVIKVNKAGIILGIIFLALTFLLLYVVGTYYPEVLAQLQGRL